MVIFGGGVGAATPYLTPHTVPAYAAAAADLRPDARGVRAVGRANPKGFSIQIDIEAWGRPGNVIACR